MRCILEGIAGGTGTERLGGPVDAGLGGGEGVRFKDMLLSVGTERTGGGTRRGGRCTEPGEGTGLFPGGGGGTGAARAGGIGGPDVGTGTGRPGGRGGAGAERAGGAGGMCDGRIGRGGG